MKTSVGKTIKELRLISKMSQEDLARLLHVTRQTISNYERDKSQPDIFTIKEIAEIFNVKTDYILNMHENDSDNEIAHLSIVHLVLLLASIILLLIGEYIAAINKADSIIYAEPAYAALLQVFVFRPLLVLAITYFTLNIITHTFIIKPSIHVRYFRILYYIILISIVIHVLIILYYELVLVGFFNDNIISRVCTNMVFFYNKSRILLLLIAAILGGVLWIVKKSKYYYLKNGE